jgi:predicted transcriptional regulator
MNLADLEPAMSPPVNAKEEVAQLLTQLPDDATLEDIQYHLYVLEKIRRGRADIEAGRSYTTEQARERLAKWLPH